MDKQRRIGGVVNATNPPTGAASAWSARATDLALWAWARLVNRKDVWGGYNDVEDRGKAYPKPGGGEGKLGNSTTRPSRGQRGKQFLVPAVLEQHFRATVPRFAKAALKSLVRRTRRCMANLGSLW